jgi:prepilin-type N-terminal cleavage/methylation domain-containing protein
MGPRRSPAFTLVEILVVLVIVGILLTMAMALTRGITAAQKRSLTATRLATVDAALVQFVQQNRRLPCPADGSVKSGDLDAFGKATGTEMRNGVICAVSGAAGSQAKGVVPWASLGLSENDATDGWDRRLTYRVDSSLAADSGMDMSWCDPAGTIAGPAGAACSNTCANATLSNCTPPIVFLSGKGLTIKNVTGTVVMVPPVLGLPPTSTAAAAYVVISPGESGGNGYLNSGQLGVTSTIDGIEEAKNYADAAMQPYYVDDSITDVASTAHFDDIVSRPAVLAVITKAGLGPRSH